MVDVFTRYVIMVPIENKFPATIALAIFRNLIAVFGVPRSILSDQGGEFVNHGLESMCTTFGISKIHTAARNSKGNGHVERFHRFCNSSLYALQIKYGPKWSEYLDAVRFCYNMVTNTSTGMSPFYLVFGRHPTLPEDVLYGFNVQDEFETQREYHIHVSERLREAYEYVRKNQYESAEENRMARTGTKIVEYYSGQPVLLWQPQQDAYTLFEEKQESVPEAPQKWTPQWTGPHVILQKTSVNNYDVVHGQSGLTMERCNVNALFPWNPWSEEISSTSTELDKETPWSLSGLPTEGTLVAVNMGKDHKDKALIGIGKLLVTPTTTTEPMSFQWISNDTEDNSKPIRLGWTPSVKPATGKSKKRKATSSTSSDVYYADERKDPADVPYTSKETSTTISSSNTLLHGFSLTSKNTIPASVKWAMDRSVSIFY